MWPVYCFNEQNGDSRWSTAETPFYRDPRVTAHEREVCDNAEHPRGRPGDLVTVQRVRKAKMGFGCWDVLGFVVKCVGFQVES